LCRCLAIVHCLLGNKKATVITQGGFVGAHLACRKATRAHDSVSRNGCDYAHFFKTCKRQLLSNMRKPVR
jgi:hypothetical protein